MSDLILDPATWLLAILVALIITAFVITWWLGLICLAIAVIILGGTIWLLNT